MPGGILVDIVDRLVNGIDHARGDDIIAVLPAPVVLRCRLARTVQDLLHTRVAADDGVLPTQPLCDDRQRPRRNVAVDEHTFRRVADRRTARLGVFNDLRRHLHPRRLVHIHMAHARARLDDRDGRLLHHRLNEPLAAARDEHVHIAVQMHERLRALMRRVGHELDGVRRDRRLLQRRAHDLRQRDVGADGFLAAAQQHGVARFQAQPRRIRRHVRARLVNDRDHADGHGDLTQPQPIRARCLFQHTPHRVGELRDLPQTVRDARDARLIQRQPVQQRIRKPACAPIRKIVRVRRQDGGGVFFNCRRDF